MSAKKKHQKHGWFAKLLDKENRTVSSTNFFVIALTIIGLILLIVPVFVLVIEVWFNHTIASDISGIAQYIGAVSTLFATAGVTKAWSTHTDNKVKMKEIETNPDGVGKEYLFQDPTEYNEEDVTEDVG